MLSWTVSMKLLVAKCQQAFLMITHNIGSGNGLVPSHNKPLPKPMLTKIYVAIWCHYMLQVHFKMNELTNQLTQCPNKILPLGFRDIQRVPDSKVHRANMGPISGRQDPGSPHVGPMNFAIWGYMHYSSIVSPDHLPWNHTLSKHTNTNPNIYGTIDI